MNYDVEIEQMLVDEISRLKRIVKKHREMLTSLNIAPTFLDKIEEEASKKP